MQERQLREWSATEFLIPPSEEMHWYPLWQKNLSSVSSLYYWVDGYLYSAIVSGKEKHRSEKHHFLVNGQLLNFCKAAGNCDYFHLPCMINQTQVDIRNSKQKSTCISKGFKLINFQFRILPGWCRCWNPHYQFINIVVKRYRFVIYASIPTKPLFDGFLIL